MGSTGNDDAVAEIVQRQADGLQSPVTQSLCGTGERGSSTALRYVGCQSREVEKMLRGGSMVNTSNVKSTPPDSLEMEGHPTTICVPIQACGMVQRVGDHWAPCTASALGAFGIAHRGLSSPGVRCSCACSTHRVSKRYLDQTFPAQCYAVRHVRSA